MRIRTVKPEFWTHPVIGRVSESAKLLAIGLLNYADDQGYFLADPVLVRAALRPFDEGSKIVRGCIEKLSRIGYLTMSEHPTHGQIGRVVAFLKHQRVDKPRVSTLKELYDSGKPPGGVGEASKGEGNGKEGKVKQPPVVPPGGDGGEQGVGVQAGVRERAGGGRQARDGEQTKSGGQTSGGEGQARKAKTPGSEEARRIAKIFNRRLTTGWSEKEIRAFKKIGQIDEEDLAAVERYYAGQAGDPENILRRDLGTFLNNYHGEVDRARADRSGGNSSNGGFTFKRPNIG